MSWLKDVIFMLGILMLGFGLWLVKPWLCFIVLGCLFIFLPLLSYIRGGK